MLTLLLLFLSIQASLAVRRYISVPNGGIKGEWGSPQECPRGTRATGIRLTVDRELTVDITGVNKIELLCRDWYHSSDSIVGTISSSEGNFGTTGKELNCNRGAYLESFCMQTGMKTMVDDVGVMNVKGRCSDGMIIGETWGNWGYWGHWGDWSDRCDNGVCVIRTRIQPYQGKFKDDSMLNDINMGCAESSHTKG